MKAIFWSSVRSVRDRYISSCSNKSAGIGAVTCESLVIYVSYPASRACYVKIGLAVTYGVQDRHPQIDWVSSARSMTFSIIRSLALRRWTIVLRPDQFLNVALAWSYLLCRPAQPLPQLLFVLLIAASMAGLKLLFRDERTELTFSGLDVGFFGLALLFLALVHRHGLSVPLGGDELYHAERVSFPIIAFDTALKNSHQTPSLEAVRSSAWMTLHPWVHPVADLWRLGTLLFGIFGVVVVLIVRRTRAGIPPLMIALGGCGVGFLGWLLGPGPEAHPPLRTLLPFLSTAILGYSPGGFRFPGIAVASVAALIAFRCLGKFGTVPLGLRGIVALSVAMIPVNFYASEAVEPSIYGFFIHFASLCLAVEVIRTKERAGIVWIAVLAALGSITRQSTVVVWVLTAGLFAWSGSWRLPGMWARCFLPSLIAVPYFASVSRLGHTATSGERGGASRIWESLVSGIGPMTALNSTTLVWVLVSGTAIVAAVVSRRAWRFLPLFLMFVPAYAMFHVISPYLWGIGRYQCEYVAPFIGLALILGIAHAPKALQRGAVVVFPLLWFSTIDGDRRVSLDTNYAEWPKMRITSSAYFPYDEVLQIVKRMELDFVLGGGTPWYPRISGWLSGYSLSETAQLEAKQQDFVRFAEQRRTPAELREYMKANSIELLVLQTGSRRELQHRTPTQSALFGSIEQLPLPARPVFHRIQRVTGPHGGMLDLYSYREP
jgi:hypothetical protein